MKASEKLLRAAGANMAASIGGSAEGAQSLLPASTGGDMYAGTGRLKGAMLLPVDRVLPDPDQPRQEFDPGDIERLARSLKERGQLQPIRVRPDPEGKRWVIIAGERRWRAAQAAGLTHVAAVEANASLSPEAILEDQLVENCLRVDLRPIEQAKAFRSLMDRLRLNQLQLSERLNLSPAAVSEALSLLTLPPSVQAAVEQGGLAPTAAVLLTRIDDPKAQERLATEAVEAKLTRSELRAAVAGQVTSKRPKKEKPKQRRVEFQLEGGASVIVSVPDPDAPDSAIDSALKRAQAQFKRSATTAA